MVYDKAGRAEEAVATYRSATRAQPNDYRIYLDFGNYYLNRGQFQQAEELYRRVVELAPAFSNGHINLGLARMQQGRFAEAEKSLTAALRIRKSAVLLVNLGALYYAQERFEDAARFFEEAIAMGPATSLRYRNLGDAYRRLGRARHASDAYRKGRALVEQDVARNPRDASSRAQLGLFSAFLGDQFRAEFELTQALAMDPENTFMLRDAIIAYESMGKRAKSLELARKAPPALLEELKRQPDLKKLKADLRFESRD